MDGRTELRGELICIVGTLVSPGPPVKLLEYDKSFGIDTKKKQELMQILEGSEGRQFFIQLVGEVITDAIPV